MRRKDRELMPEEAWEIVDRCADGVVSMMDDAGAPYAVPVNLVREDNRVYFHSAMAGKKADCMQSSGICNSSEQSTQKIRSALADRSAWALRLSKKYASMLDNRAAGEFEGARPASNLINRRRKP